jgi:hypothetical protein
MIADSTFSSFVSDDVVNNLRAAGDEFNEAARQGNLTESLGQKYIRALTAYERELYDCPYSPTTNMVQPTAHDSVMMGRMREELARVQKERSRVVNQFGGYLSMDED